MVLAVALVRGRFPSGCLPLLGVGLARFFRWSFRAGIAAAVCWLAALGPHAPQGRVSEFYAHSIVAVVVIVLAAGRGKSAARERRTAGFALVLFLAGAAFVDAHKLVEMIHTGRGSDQVAREIVSLVPEPPSEFCVVARGLDDWPGYSVYVAPPGPASDWGYSARHYWGWDEPVRFRWVREAVECENRSVVVSVSTAGEVRRL